MKPLLSAILLLAITACNNDNSPALVKSSAVGTVKKKDAADGPVVRNGVEGYYSGVFDVEKSDPNKESHQNQITLCIMDMQDGAISGYSIVAGNKRPFTGEYTKLREQYEVEASEPGDDRYDGNFYFVIDAKKKTVAGRWKANDQKLAVTERSYKLLPRTFKYDPDLELPADLVGAALYNSMNEDGEKSEFLTEDAVSINASKVLLKSKDVENMYKADLEVMRNAIYARHGYAFKNTRMRLLFDNTVEWYMPFSLDVEPVLTELEKKNIALIKRYEKHASRYYEYFGR